MVITTIQYQAVVKNENHRSNTIMVNDHRRVLHFDKAFISAVVTWILFQSDIMLFLSGISSVST